MREKRTESFKSKAEAWAHWFMSFESQSLSISILVLQLSMNSANVLLNFPLVSMKEHLPFAGILIVRTKTLLATRVPTNSLNPLRGWLPTELWNMCVPAVTSTQYGNVGEMRPVLFACTSCLSPMQISRFWWQQGRNRGIILSLGWTFILGCLSEGVFIHLGSFLGS